MKHLYGEVLRLWGLILNRRHHCRAMPQHVCIGALFDLTAGPNGKASRQAHDMRMTLVHAAIDDCDTHPPAGA